MNAIERLARLCAEKDVQAGGIENGVMGARLAVEAAKARQEGMTIEGFIETLPDDLAEWAGGRDELLAEVQRQRG